MRAKPGAEPAFPPLSPLPKARNFHSIVIILLITAFFVEFS